MKNQPTRARSIKSLSILIVSGCLFTSVFADDVPAAIATNTPVTLRTATNALYPESSPAVLKATQTDEAHTIVLAVTKHAVWSGVLVSQTSSNITISSFGKNETLKKEDLLSCDLRQVPAVEKTKIQISTTDVPGGNVASNSGKNIIAELNKPHSESEMRTLLQTPEAQDMLKQVADAIIGTGTDPQTAAARSNYFEAMQQFGSGVIGISDIQASAQSMLGQLQKYQPEMQNDPQAQRWNDYRSILQGFLNVQAAPSIRQSGY